MFLTPIGVFAQTLSLEASRGIVEALQVEFTDDIVPHMYQIILCESSGRQNVSHLNKNGTTDYGLLQINSIHFEEAANLGLDFVGSREDNIRMARLIYEKQGYSAWKVCSAKLSLE